MHNFGSGSSGTMNNIIKYCNKNQCISGNNTPYLKKATAGNDPSITKVMRCASNVKNTRRHNCFTGVVSQNGAIILSSATVLSSATALSNTNCVNVGNM